MPVTAEKQPSSHASSGSEVASFRQVLRNRNFLLLWLAQLISQTILNAANFGLIVIVTNVTHSVLAAGLAIIAFTFPAVPFGAIAGVVVDHLPKRSVLWISNILRAITIFTFTASLLLNNNNLWPLYVLMFTTSLIGQFFTPAESASIPLLVGDHELVPALSLFNVTITLAQAIGYLVVGSAISLIFPSFILHIGSLALNVQSSDVLFLFVAVFYVVCAGLILLIPAPAFHEKHSIHIHRTQHPAIETRESMKVLWHDIAYGWRFVRSDQLLYFAVIQLSVAGNVLLIIAELAGPFVQQVLHLPAGAMSIVLAPAAVGLVGASLFMPRFTGRIGKVRLTMIGLIILGIGFFFLPGSRLLATYLYGPAAAGSALLWTAIITLVLVMGMAMACVNIPMQTLMQEHAPEEVRGRIFSLQLMLYNAGSIPVLLFAGLFAQYLNLNLLIVLLGAIMLLLFWWGRSYLNHPEKARLSSE
jgi:MFS family permease